MAATEGSEERNCRLPDPRMHSSGCCPAVVREQAQSLSAVVAADSVKQFVELFRVTEADSYDHDLLVSALLLLHALLEGHGEASPNQNLQEVFAIQLKTAGLLEFLSDMLDYGDSYVRRRAQQVGILTPHLSFELHETIESSG